MAKPYVAMFLNDLGHSWHVGDEVCTGEIGVIPELCLPGTTRMRMGVLATLADLSAGALSNRTIAPRIPLTVDLTTRVVGPMATERLTMIAGLLKVGRSTVVVETVFRDDDERMVALAHATFMASPRPEDVMEEIHWGVPPRPPRLSAPIMDQIGARIVSPGLVELDRLPYVMQPSGTVQGGAVALIAERAAESLAEAPVEELEIKYLSSVRVGPARATATRLTKSLIRVEIRDPGNADRLATLAMARTG